MKIKNKSLNLTQIKDFQLGQNIFGFFICIEKQYRISKSGNPYLNIILLDISSKIEGKLWNNVDYFNEQFQKGDPVAVKGIPVDFNGKICINISQIKFAKKHIYNKYGFNSKNLIRTISLNPEKIFKEIISLINNIKSKFLKELCFNIFTKNKDEILVCPASIKDHYPIKGGLLLHLFNCLKLAIQSLKNYNYLKKDLLFSGILLNDIGKIKCYSGEYLFIENDYSKLNGHNTIGLELIDNEILKISNFPIEVKQLLLHILFFQNNSLNKNNINSPKFPEALAIFNIKKMDIEIDIMNRIISDKNDVNRNWTNRNNYFSTSLYIQ